MPNTGLVLMRRRAERTCRVLREWWEAENRLGPSGGCSHRHPYEQQVLWMLWQEGGAVRAESGVLRAPSGRGHLNAVHTGAACPDHRAPGHGVLHVTHGAGRDATRRECPRRALVHACAAPAPNATAPGAAFAVPDFNATAAAGELLSECGEGGAAAAPSGALVLDPDSCPHAARVLSTAGNGTGDAAAAADGDLLTSYTLGPGGWAALRFSEPLPIAALRFAGRAWHGCMRPPEGHSAYPGTPALFGGGFEGLDAPTATSGSPLVAAAPWGYRVPPFLAGATFGEAPVPAGLQRTRHWGVLYRAPRNATAAAALAELRVVCARG
eukprot:TRINITY_DN24560_c0_g2_i1.p2 TRINITY_DN24560_c0_g2~~TRINITY_DN24560_c0_g2_i1.p2  ORF type:complete len:325 (+),score=60.85 TRINITY_DN24560_c0_g2_i1:341-1315(+)